MNILTGKVLSVETRDLGESTTAAAAIGATVLAVTDAATFDEFGGALSVAGETLAYVGTDVEADTVTLADPLLVAVDEGASVEVYPATPVKTALVSLDDGGDMITTTVPHSLLDRFVDGVRDAGQAESVTLERRGNYEFLIADAVAEPLTQTSLDFEVGDQGYGLTEAGQQMQDLAVLGNLGAEAAVFGTINLGGADLSTELAGIPRSSRYAIRGAAGAINAGSTAGTTELRFFTFNCGPVAAGRLYHVEFRALGQGTVGDVFWGFIHYTTDGSEPTISSPIMLGGQTMVPVISAGIGRALVNFSTFFPSSTSGELRIAISFQRLSGTGTFLIRADSENFSIQVACTDRGIGLDSATSLQQTAKVDGSGSDNPPIITYVKTFEATWAQSYFPGGDAYANHGNSDTLWAGYDSSLGAPVAGIDDPDLSLIGFDYTAIAAALSSSTTMQKCELLYRGRYRKVATGLDLKFLTHDYSSWPGIAIDAYNISGVPNTHLTFLSTAQGNIANGVNYAIDLGATVGNQFKASTRRGAGIIGQDLGDDSRGYIYGVGATYKPKLRFTYLGTG